MGGGKIMIRMMLIMAIVNGLGYGGKWAEAQIHHVVGDDPGWDVASDIASWASRRFFAVGDFLWFAYSSGLEKEKVVEVRSKEEFESCDVSNPIKMYTDGLDKIPLEEEGIRFFVSSNPENCKQGLKLPVEVRPKSMATIQSTQSQNAALAQQPTSPSLSTKISGPIMIILAAVLFTYVAPYVL